MKDRDLTWEIVNFERPRERLFKRYCWLNSCCENCNKRVRFWCAVRELITKHQEKIIKKSLDKRQTHSAKKGGAG